jgi:putative DNA primase/helicase
MDDVFEKARTLISESIIRKYFDCEKSEIYKRHGKRELKTLCPFRQDNNIGSFFINLDTGLWQDYADKSEGDFIKLVSRAYGLTLLDAAKKIINDTGGVIPVKPTKVKEEKKRVKPMIPIPDKALSKLNIKVNEKWIKNRYGEAVAGYQYRNKDNKLWMCTVRFEDGKVKKDGKPKKDVIPFYFGIDERWHMGYSINKSRPLYNEQKLDKNKIVLIVEGEKNSGVEVDGYVNVSWAGGCGNIRLTSFYILKDYDVTVWLDYDDPGLKAAKYLKSILPHAYVMNIWEYFKRKEQNIES